jgi:hypothetical protein
MPLTFSAGFKRPNSTKLGKTYFSLISPAEHITIAHLLNWPLAEIMAIASGIALGSSYLGDAPQEDI